jgi:hypothetical protein
MVLSEAALAGQQIELVLNACIVLLREGLRRGGLRRRGWGRVIDRFAHGFYLRLLVTPSGAV